MPPQLWTFYLYLCLTILIVAVFLWVALTSRRPREIDAGAAARLRLGFLVLLVVILTSALGLTLRKVPYDLWEGEIPGRTVFVAGKQFAFAVSESPITTEEEWEIRTMSEPVEVEAGELVELRVTSFDVNHSVGLFDPGGTLIGQLQSMPGYVNRLRTRFEQPGRHFIFCLELCGNGHSRMRAVLDVVDGTGR